MPTREAQPRFVPVTEVANYTDSVFIDSLGLPVGFDEERLGVNVRGLNAVRFIMGAETLHITSQSGEESPIAISGKVNGDGSLASTAAATRSTQRPSTARKPGRTSAVVELNRAAIADQSPELGRNVRSVQARARALNKAIKPGLSQAAYYSLELDSKFGAGYSMTILGVANAAALSDGSYSPVEIAGVLGIGPFIWALYGGGAGRPSLFPFWPVDRYAVARGKIATTRFFAEKK